MHLIGQSGHLEHSQSYGATLLLHVSTEPGGDSAHTQQSIACASPSQVGEHWVTSRYVSAQSHFRGMDGKSRKFDPGKGVVNTPLCATEPRVPLRSDLDDPEGWELPCSDGESACWDEVHRTELVACRPIIKCGTMGCAGSCLLSVAEYGYTVGTEPVTCGICVKTNWVSRNVLPREQSAPSGVVEEDVSLAATTCP